jgi:predicted Zn finger-like uncharacterized protein
MLIVCPHCASTYDIEMAALGGKGRPVRCGVCRTLWFAVPDEPEESPALASSPPPPRMTAREKFDAFVRVCSILTMMMFGTLTGFAMMGEWPRWLIPLARAAGLEKPLWPELDGVVARLETTPEGATILSIEGQWIGAMRSAATPAVEFAVRNAAEEEVARWTDRSGPTKLPAGETAPFRSRFAIPGGDARDIRVRYVGFVPGLTEPFEAR